MEYFEDLNLSLSKRSVDPAHRGRRNRIKSAVLQRSHFTYIDKLYMVKSHTK